MSNTKNIEDEPSKDFADVEDTPNDDEEEGEGEEEDDKDKQKSEGDDEEDAEEATVTDISTGIQEEREELNEADRVLLHPSKTKIFENKYVHFLRHSLKFKILVRFKSLVDINEFLIGSAIEWILFLGFFFVWLIVVKELHWAEEEHVYPGLELMAILTGILWFATSVVFVFYYWASNRPECDSYMKGNKNMISSEQAKQNVLNAVAQVMDGSDLNDHDKNEHVALKKKNSHHTSYNSFGSEKKKNAYANCCRSIWEFLKFMCSIKATRDILFFFSGAILNLATYQGIFLRWLYLGPSQHFMKEKQKLYLYLSLMGISMVLRVIFCTLYMVFYSLNNTGYYYARPKRDVV